MAEELDGFSYSPAGGTALFDAIGETLKSAEERIGSCSCGNKRNKVLVAILTDGMENSSRVYSGEQIKKMIEGYQDEHGWQFQYLAISEKELKDGLAKQGMSLGIAEGDIFLYNNSAVGVDTSYNTLSATAASMRETATEGQTISK